MRVFGFTQYGGPDVTQFLEVPAPKPGPQHILIQVTASGVNPGDIKVRSGERQGSFPVAFPMAMGREAAGVVLEVDEEITHIRPGDRVFGSAAATVGTLGEQALLSGVSTTVIPDGVTDAQASSIPVAMATAFDGLDELDLPAEATLLVLGAGGGVGSSTCALARLRDIRVLAVASEGKRALVESLGAHHVLKGDGWVDRVRALAPEGVDGVIDAVGGSTLRQAATVLHSPGALRSAADYATATELGGSPITRRRISAVYNHVAQLIAEGAFSPVIYQEYDFDQAADAVAVVESGHATGNVIVRGTSDQY